MTDETGYPRSQSTGPDVDAYRRHRGDRPTRGSTTLIAALSGMGASDSPVVIFTRLAEACVPAFSDGCDVDIVEDHEPAFRKRVEFAPGAVAPGAAMSLAENTELPVSAPIAVPVIGQARAGYGAYAGVVSFWWHRRGPEAAEVTMAELVVQHGIDLVDRHRLSRAADLSDAGAAAATMSAIVSRQVSIAVGVMMRDQSFDEDAAEQALRDLAARRQTDVYSVAVQVVHSARPASSTDAADAAGATAPRPLRPVAKPD